MEKSIFCIFRVKTGNNNHVKPNKLYGGKLFMNRLKKLLYVITPAVIMTVIMLLYSYLAGN
ncbi:MAG TPA: hypothetical protein DD733_12940 [Clostridiales bacterium]|nr:hypothetical protein [Clostridiales bacterium]